jgi:uncharacterized protein YcfJ
MGAFRSEGGLSPAWRIVACAAAPRRACRRTCNTPRVPLDQFLIAITIAAAISMGTFAHADRHGSGHATAWGIGAFLAAGIVVPIYFVRYWLRKRRTDGT